jgi:alpha-beta hydrolase superfamily lysophospholipase
VTAALLLLLASPAPAAPPESVRFKTSDGVELAAVYNAPADGGRVALLVHGAGAGKGEWTPLADALRRRGLGSLAIDLRGHGESAGSRDDFNERDLDAALAFLKKRGVPASRAGAVGGSIGANLVSRLARRTPKLAFAVLLSPGADYRGVAPARLRGRRALAAASPGDAYAFETVKSLGLPELIARRGHGAQMLAEPEFLSALVDWIATSP